MSIDSKVLKALTPKFDPEIYKKLNTHLNACSLALIRYRTTEWLKPTDLATTKSITEFEDYNATILEASMILFTGLETDSKTLATINEILG